MSSLLTLNILHTLFYCSIVDFEQVNAGWASLTNRATYPDMVASTLTDIDMQNDAVAGVKQYITC